MTLEEMFALFELDLRHIFWVHSVTIFVLDHFLHQEGSLLRYFVILVDGRQPEFSTVRMHFTISNF
jgi:hypothetical protein